ncbi:MAG: hypothetical protein WAV09_03390 [Minisyncoccia bacterium]
MARRRRRFSGIVSLGGLTDIVGGSVATKDVLMGLVAGVVGGLGLKYVLNKYLPSVSAQLGKLGGAVPFATGLSIAAALFYAQKGSQAAKGQALGAAGAGAAISLLGYAADAAAKAGFAVSGYGGPAMALNLSNYSGLLVDNAAQRPMNGLIVDNNANLSRLGALSMGGDDEVGYSDIVALRS